MRLKTKLNIHLTELEQRKLIRLAKVLDLDISGVTVIRNKALTWNKNVVCFSILHPNTVYIAHDVSIDRLMPHIAHELKHREQFNRGKVAYMLGITFARWVLEEEAYAEQERIELQI